MRHRGFKAARSADRFDNYRELRARFDDQASCGHAVERGEVIGWHPTLRKAKRASCWSRWVQENRDAQEYEDRYCTPEYGYGDGPESW